MACGGVASTDGVVVVLNLARAAMSDGGGGVHSFFAKTAERMKKRQQSDTMTVDAGAASDTSASAAAATPTTTHTHAARTRRKVSTSESRREQPEMAKSMFFKTPAERTAMKAERQRLADAEVQRLAAAADRREDRQK